MANWFSELFGDNKNATPVQDQPPVPSWLAQRYEAIKDQPPTEPYRYNTDQLDQWAHPDAQWAMTHDFRINPAFAALYPEVTKFTPDNLSDEQRKAYQANIKAMSDNPLAMLGADPSKTRITSNDGGNLGGSFNSSTGQLTLGPNLDSQKHESLHAGLQRLRELGDASVFEQYAERVNPTKYNGIDIRKAKAYEQALADQREDDSIRKSNEEILVRSIMQKRNGNYIYDDPEKEDRPKLYTDTLNDPKIQTRLQDRRQQVMDAADRRYRIQRDLIAKGTSHPLIAPGEPPVTSVKPKMRRGPIMDSRQDK